MRSDYCITTCSCCNSLAYPREISIDDVQHVMYGSNLGLELPARDPWSYMTLEEIKSSDFPWLDNHFSHAGSVPVMERLAAYAGARRRGDRNAPDRGGPPAHPGLVRRPPTAILFEQDSGGEDSDNEEDIGPAMSLRGGAGELCMLYFPCALTRYQAAMRMSLSLHKATFITQ